MPRFLGIDEAGREILSFLPGTVPVDLGAYDDTQIRAAAALLRRFHDATATLPLLKGTGCDVVCHNDWAPTNTIFLNDMPIAMIDFDTAQPGERLWDLGYSAFTWLDLGNDDYTPGEQIRRLEVFADGYGEVNCTPTRIAVYVVARQAALAASAGAREMQEMAAWAMNCMHWTALNILARLLPTGYVFPARSSLNM